MKNRFITIFFFVFSIGVYAQKHEYMIGTMANFYTNFQTYSDLPMGLKMTYLRTLSEKEFASKGKTTISLGFSTGFLFQLGNEFPRGISASKPFRIPLGANFEYYLSPWEKAGFVLQYSGGLNINIHGHGVLNPLLVSGIGIGTKIALTSKYNLRIIAQYGVQGYTKDYWFGPGFSISFGQRIRKREKE